MILAIVILAVTNVVSFIFLIVVANRLVKVSDDLVESRAAIAELQLDFTQHKNESRKQITAIRNQISY